MNEILPQGALRLGLKRFSPRPELSALVDCLWATGGVGTALQQCTEKVYPDAGCSLTIVITPDSASAGFACNRHTASQQFSTRHLTISARLLPGALFSLFQLSPAELPEHYCDASLVLTGQTKHSLQLLLAQLPQASLTDAISAFEHWLMTLSTQFAAAPRLAPMLQLLRQHAITVQMAADTIGVSRRTLERQMTLHTGFNPAYFKHCLQIKQARQLLCQPKAALADIAVLTGFYDQAHFSRAFSTFVGETPAQYRNRKLSQIYNTTASCDVMLG